MATALTAGTGPATLPEMYLHYVSFGLQPSSFGMSGFEVLTSHR